MTLEIKNQNNKNGADESSKGTPEQSESYYPLTGRICPKGSELSMLGKTLLVLVSLGKQQDWFTPEELYPRVKRSDLTLEQYIEFLARASSVGGFLNSSSRLHPDTGKMEHKFKSNVCLVID